MKPELPHDEQLARVSRDARYTFVLLWTIADDAGFFRASLKYLVGVLYPHDTDVTADILKGWLKELADIKRIGWKRLTDDTPVGYIANWKKHQRIDHPSRSFFSDNLAKDSRGAREDGAKGVSESLVSESLSPESQVKALVSLRETLPTEAVAGRTEERKRREKGLLVAAEVVFMYWQARMGHPRAIFVPKDDRTKKLIARLRENGGDVDELLDVIDGAMRDEYIMGRDPKAPRAYDGIETLYRSRAQVERFVQLARVTRPAGEHHPFIAQWSAEHGRPEEGA